MNRSMAFLWSTVIVALLVGVALITIWVYSVGQLRVLQDQTAWACPEDGMRALIANSYSGVSKVEIVHAGKEIFDDLWFVEAYVWANSRCDGKGFSGRGWDNPGSFFLRVPNGWVSIPEGRFPEVIACGKWLFGLSG